MNLKEIGEKLVEHCRNHTERQGLDELYHVDAVSVESAPNPETGSREVHGIDAIKGKHEWWDSQVEMTGGETIGPLPHGEDRFAVIFRAAGKDKASGETFNMEEVGVYHVANGKIVREEFFYAM